MRVSVIISNYNYGQFVADAVRSALGQQPPPHEIIVVDDGSTDHSIQVVRDLASEHESIRVVAKPNGGQLSAFNAGFEECEGDVVCFLDADDEFLPGYLARLVQVYSERPTVDFVYCTVVYVKEGIPLHKSSDATASLDHGITFFRTLILGDWVGSPTSGLSARRWVLQKILPCPLERGWRIRADDVLVIGAAMVSARKMHLAETFVRYRIHGCNSWFGAPEETGRVLRERLERHGLAGYFARDAARSLAVRHSWRSLVIAEFRTIPRPTLKDARLYCRIVGLVRGSYGLAWTSKLRIYRMWFMRRCSSLRDDA